MDRRELLKRLCGVGGAVGLAGTIEVANPTLDGLLDWRDENRKRDCPVCGKICRTWEIKKANTSNAANIYATYAPLTRIYYHEDGDRCSLQTAVVHELPSEHYKYCTSKGKNRRKILQIHERLTQGGT